MLKLLLCLNFATGLLPDGMHSDGFGRPPRQFSAAVSGLLLSPVWYQSRLKFALGLLSSGMQFVCFSRPLAPVQCDRSVTPHLLLDINPGCGPFRDALTVNGETVYLSLLRVAAKNNSGEQTFIILMEMKFLLINAKS